MTLKPSSTPTGVADTAASLVEPPPPVVELDVETALNASPVDPPPPDVELETVAALLVELVEPPPPETEPETTAPLAASLVPAPPPETELETSTAGPETSRARLMKSCLRRISLA